MIAVVSAATVVLGLTAQAVGTASALPDPQPNYVTTLRCDSANPWPAPRIPVWVDVYNQIAFPSDGLPGPAISLVGSSRAKPGVLEFTVEVTVAWRNLRTGRTGTVRVPTRTQVVGWEVVLHPGSGPVSFTINQKIGALAFVPMVNPQYSSCRGRATA
ncbi:hypothetical protein QNM97_06940 [Gordonia sp. L191]|uniref:hypothetical protein n=1 Tax=Gordonia sp. L191 TaxID=2982699 RepID=UPI0024BF3528|nr:hypothetical protein [Gordonia sp. L191]WHU49904.1 hypothetical protein QNM97_06940 [Gordonia sp. L191]